MKKGALFCLKGFIREPKPSLLGILVWVRGITHSMELPLQSPSLKRLGCIWVFSGLGFRVYWGVRVFGC